MEVLPLWAGGRYLSQLFNTVIVGPGMTYSPSVLSISPGNTFSS